MTQLTQEYLKSILRYNPDTGEWTWLVNRGRKAKKGQIAGSLKDGRIRLKFLGKSYYSARLAWFYMNGEWPLQEIDHSNQNPMDDRWSNLRLATDSQQMVNRAVTKKSSKLPKWVVKSKKGGYRVRVTMHGKRKHVGYYKTIELAEKAANEFAKNAHGEFFNNRIVV